MIHFYCPCNVYLKVYVSILSYLFTCKGKHCGYSAIYIYDLPDTSILYFQMLNAPHHPTPY